MRVFLTGATGFIGSRILSELLTAGHEVLGLARTDVGARWLEEAGARVFRGTLEDPDDLAAGAVQADAVIHTAFDHDFSRFVENCEKDGRAIRTMGALLAGSERPFIVTSVVGMGITTTGEPALEQAVDWRHPNPRAASEQAGAEAAARGVSVATVRLPQVHNPFKQCLVTWLIEVARATGMSAYIGDGPNRWPAAHVSDVARLYRLALEQHEPGARYHAVAEEGVPVREIAETIGLGLGVPVVSLSPEEGRRHFGWLAMFAGLDMPASSNWTRRRLGWQPTGPGLINDLEAYEYRLTAAE